MPGTGSRFAFAPDPHVERVASKALAAARSCTDGYKRIAASAWPVRALTERHKVHRAHLAIEKLLLEAADIDHPVSRMDALALLWHASRPLPAAISHPALDALLASCQAAHSWKAGSMLRDVCLIVATDDRAAAQRIIDEMGKSGYKRQAQRRLDAGAWETVRSFF